MLGAPPSALGAPMRALGIPSCLLVCLLPTLHAQATPAAKPTALHWSPAPAVFPKGAKMAVVAGDPAQAAPFTVELAMPAGYKILPHFHPTDETVTVKKGAPPIGGGGTVDVSTIKTMKIWAT